MQDEVRGFQNVVRVLPSVLFFIGIPLIGITGAVEHLLARPLQAAWLLSVLASIALAKYLSVDVGPAPPRGIR